VQIPPGVGPTGATLAARVGDFLGKETCVVCRIRKDGGRPQELDVRPLVELAEVQGVDELRMQVLAPPEGGVRLLELLGALLGLEEHNVRMLRMRKTHVENLSPREEPTGAVREQKGVAEDHVV
jgi:hypothetical protein